MTDARAVTAATDVVRVAIDDRGDRRPDPIPERPKPKRLRPGRTNRNAVLDEVAPEMRPIAEQVLKGGVPAVREAVAEQNKAA